jgi:hypothetical protein
VLGHASLARRRWRLLLHRRLLLGMGGSHQHGYDSDGDERFHWKLLERSLANLHQRGKYLRSYCNDTVRL